MNGPLADHTTDDSAQSPRGLMSMTTSRIVAGPSDESLRRAGLIRYAEDGQNVPESCKLPARYDEKESKYHVPLATQDCITAILGVEKSHILTAEDVVKLAKWWAKNSKDTSQGAWLILYGALLAMVGKPLTTAQTGADATFDRIKTPTEDLSNEIADSVGGVFGFITDPQNWLSMGALVIGGILLFVGLKRYLSGS